MYKKIGRFTISMGLFSMFGSFFGMNRDVIMSKLVRKEIIPILALNNYIVNVPTAYQALRKEASLPYVSLKNMRYGMSEIIKQVNDDDRALLQSNGLYVYTIDVPETGNETMNIIRKVCQKRIAIVYKNLSNHSGNCNASMKIDTFIYHISHSHLHYQQLPAINYSIKNVSHLLKNELGNLLKKGNSVHIELAVHDNLSHWIRVTNFFNPGEYSNGIMLPALFSKKRSLPQESSPLLGEEENSLFHSRDLDYNSIDLEGIKICSCSLIFGTAVLASVLLGMSFYGS